MPGFKEADLLRHIFLWGGQYLAPHRRIMHDQKITIFVVLANCSMHTYTIHILHMQCMHEIC
jgi:hypothetical protein